MPVDEFVAELVSVVGVITSHHVRHCSVADCHRKKAVSAVVVCVASGEVEGKRGLVESVMEVGRGEGKVDALVADCCDGLIR